MILRNGKLQKLVGITDIMSFEKIIWKELRDPEKKRNVKRNKKSRKTKSENETHKKKN